MTSRSVKASAKPKPRSQSEKKTFATLPKVPLKKKAQGAIAKLPRVFPGMSSRSTSSRSVGSVGVKSATHQSRRTVISAFSSQKKARTTVGITQASVHSFKDLEGSIPTEVVTTKKVVNTRSGEQPSFFQYWVRCGTHKCEQTDRTLDTSFRGCCIFCTTVAWR